MRTVDLVGVVRDFDRSCSICLPSHVTDAGALTGERIVTVTGPLDNVLKVCTSRVRLIMTSKHSRPQLSLSLVPPVGV